MCAQTLCCCGKIHIKSTILTILQCTDLQHSTMFTVIGRHHHYLDTQLDELLHKCVHLCEYFLDQKTKTQLFWKVLSCRLPITPTLMGASLFTLYDGIVLFDLDRAHINYQLISGFCHLISVIFIVVM